MTNLPVDRGAASHDQQISTPVSSYPTNRWIQRASEPEIPGGESGVLGGPREDS
jgi:hypothetical protein